MNLYLTLRLMATPTLIGSLLTVGILTERAFAAPASQANSVKQVTCDVSPSRELKSLRLQNHHQGAIVASADLSGNTAMLDFSEAESDAAAVLFGCDCPPCINALRQLRNQSLLNTINGKGHCWTSMQRRVSPQTMQKVLQNLERQEAEKAR